MQTFNIVKNKIKELNDYNNISFYNEVLKYNIVHIGDETSIIQKNILDKITKEEEVCETIELTNWIIENYDTGSLNYYIHKIIEDKRIDPDGKIEKFLDEQFSKDFDNL